MNSEQLTVESGSPIAASGFAGLGAFCALVAAIGRGLALFSAARPQGVSA